MTTGALMGRKRKGNTTTQSPTATSQATEPEKAKETELVKLRKDFKERLQLIAQDTGIAMGDLVEQQMHDFVSREYLHILERKLQEAKDNMKRHPLH